MPEPVLIGTLHCGEADFEHGRASVQRQDIPCSQYVISDLPEPEANLRLYRTFKDSGAAYMVRLDADMVLARPDAVRLMVERIAATGALKVSHPVDDFFTGGPMMGIHLYSQGVEFDWAAFAPGQLFPDRANNVLRAPPRERARVWRIFDEPLAWHCRYANDHQSFHFGYHRWMKRQFPICRRVLERSASLPGEPRLLLACAGMLAAARAPSSDAVSYGAAFEHARAGSLSTRADPESIRADVRARLAAESPAAPPPNSAQPTTSGVTRQRTA
ncbi:MAG: hypothetical protein JNM07_11350 [Phycisphaerae bacterium]|nr:hypothetical protein [Phycisphaerae bacterium]